MIGVPSVQTNLKGLRRLEMCLRPFSFERFRPRPIVINDRQTRDDIQELLSSTEAGTALTFGVRLDGDALGVSVWQTINGCTSWLMSLDRRFYDTLMCIVALAPLEKRFLQEQRFSPRCVRRRVGLTGTEIIIHQRLPAPSTLGEGLGRTNPGVDDDGTPFGVALRACIYCVTFINRRSR